MAALYVRRLRGAIPSFVLGMATLALLVSAPVVLAAPGDCVLRAAVDPAAGDEGSTSLTVEPDVEVTLWGSFIPNAQIDLEFTWNGAPHGDFTPGIADAEGDFLFLHSFPPSQVGTWTVTASVEATECAGSVEISVSAAGAVSPGASPSALPNTALTRPAEAGAAATVPAVAVLATALATALAFGMLTLAGRRRRARFEDCGGSLTP